MRAESSPAKAWSLSANCSASSTSSTSLPVCTRAAARSAEASSSPTRSGPGRLGDRRTTSAPRPRPRRPGTGRAPPPRAAGSTYPSAPARRTSRARPRRPRARRCRGRTRECRRQAPGLDLELGGPELVDRDRRGQLPTTGPSGDVAPPLRDRCNGLLERPVGVATWACSLVSAQDATPRDRRRRQLGRHAGDAVVVGSARRNSHRCVATSSTALGTALEREVVIASTSARRARRRRRGRARRAAAGPRSRRTRPSATPSPSMRMTILRCGPGAARRRSSSVRMNLRKRTAAPACPNRHRLTPPCAAGRRAARARGLPRSSTSRSSSSGDQASAMVRAIVDSVVVVRCPGMPRTSRLPRSRSQPTGSCSWRRGVVGDGEVHERAAHGTHAGHARRRLLARDGEGHALTERLGPHRRGGAKPSRRWPRRSRR